MALPNSLLKNLAAILGLGDSAAKGRPATRVCEEGPRALGRLTAQGPEIAAPSPPPASSIAAPSKEGICGPLHRWSGMRATRIGERALSILQKWLT
jgi:hypothetical protein